MGTPPPPPPPPPPPTQLVHRAPDAAPLKKTSFSGGAYGLVSVSPSWLVKNVFGRGMVDPAVALDVIDGMTDDIIDDNEVVDGTAEV